MASTLVVIRHAKSDWSHDLPDEQRPLNQRGHREAPLAGRWVQEHVGAIDLVICSTATRARETLRRSGLTAPELRHDERVYAATPGDLMSVIDEIPETAGTAALIGHNPGLSELVALLTGETVELKTSAIAVVRWPGTWPDVWSRNAALVSHATPRG